jgi:hypothetical protein
MVETDPKFVAPGGTTFTFEEGAVRIFGEGGTEIVLSNQDFRAFVEHLDRSLCVNPSSLSTGPQRSNG